MEAISWILQEKLDNNIVMIFALGDDLFLLFLVLICFNSKNECQLLPAMYNGGLIVG